MPKGLESLGICTQFNSEPHETPNLGEVTWTMDKHRTYFLPPLELSQLFTEFLPSNASHPYSWHFHSDIQILKFTHCGLG